MDLAPRRPDVATPACVAGNGGVGSPGDNVLPAASYEAAGGLARGCLCGAVGRTPDKPR